jgi:hypothetical protein
MSSVFNHIASNFSRKFEFIFSSVDHLAASGIEPNLMAKQSLFSGQLIT